MTRWMAAFRPSCASEITSFTPRRPRRTRSSRNAAQKGSASEGPMCRPTISRRPSVFAATAIMAATETVRGRRAMGSSAAPNAALAHLQVGRVQPEIGPVALQRALREGADPLVDVLAQLRDLALAAAAQTHGLDEIVHLPGRHPRDPVRLRSRTGGDSPAHPGSPRSAPSRSSCGLRGRAGSSCPSAASGCAGSAAPAACRASGRGSRCARSTARRCARSARRRSDPPRPPP